ncbi:MAG: hypothetical protein ACR2K6_06135 [Solirubrobacterales bacterium]
MSQLRRRESIIGGAGAADGNNRTQVEIDDALAELDRLTRQFAGGVSELGGDLDRNAPARTSDPLAEGSSDSSAAESAPREPSKPAIAEEPSQPSPPPPRTHSEQELSFGGAKLEQVADPFEVRMKAAEDEAKRYLDQAKGRADKLVQSMIGAVEQEAEQIQHEAQQRIRARFERAETEAGQYAERAQRVSEEMVADRQQRIAELSDGITLGASALTTGMEDAKRVQDQFEGFVQALSKTASRIAQGSTQPGSHRQPLGSLKGVEQKSASSYDLVA